METAAIPSAPAAWERRTFDLSFEVKTAAGQMTSTIAFDEPTMETLERIEGIASGMKGDPTLKQTRQIIEAFAGLDDGALAKLKKGEFLALSEVVTPLIEAALSDGREQPPKE